METTKIELNKVLKAVDMTIENPKQDIASSLGSMGISIAATTSATALFSFGSAVALMLCPLGFTTILIPWGYKKIRQWKNNNNEKYRQLQEIIIKQQAIIDALYSKVHHSEQEIMNLKETLEFLSHIVKEATKKE